MMRFVLSCFFLFAISVLQAQTLDAFGMRFAGDLTTWDIYADDGETEGELRAIYDFSGDFSRWEYSLGDDGGRISQKFPNDPTWWELRDQSGDIITIKMLWRNDPTQWGLSSDGTRYDLRTYRGRDPNEWLLTTPDGDLYIYTEWENAFDIFLIDDMTEGFDLSWRIAALFALMLATQGE